MTTKSEIDEFERQVNLADWPDDRCNGTDMHALSEVEFVRVELQSRLYDWNHYPDQAKLTALMNARRHYARVMVKLSGAAFAAPNQQEKGSPPCPPTS
jgi:hypothetical protein